YDYSGYRQSTGKAAYICVKEQYGAKGEKIILYGQSVRSGPTLDLASHVPKLRVVVLYSPILSCLRVLYPGKRTYWFDIYKNIDKILLVSYPVLVIHWMWPFNLELYPEYIKHMKKFVSAIGKSKASSTSSSKSTKKETTNEQTKLLESAKSELYENILDRQLEKSKKPSKNEKSRMSVD
ncbi:hypothetical protein MKX03_014870, partial [Papaver bracteatum]